MSEAKERWQELAYIRKIYSRAKSRATQKKRAFNIELSDIVIPPVCPIFGTALVHPSIDRIDSSKGYVKGNIQIVSRRANLLKNDGTLEEFRKIVQWFERGAGGICEI